MISTGSFSRLRESAMILLLIISMLSMVIVKADIMMKYEQNSLMPPMLISAIHMRLKTTTNTFATDFCLNKFQFLNCQITNTASTKQNILKGGALDIPCLIK
jgi:hypothetical protein